jgi:hypothetical protein
MHHYPSFKKFFSQVACKSSLAFLEKYPSPSKLGDVTLEDLTKYLYQYGKSGININKVGILFDNLKKDGDTTSQYQDTRDSIVVYTVKQIKNNNEQISNIEKQIKEFLKLFDYKLETMRGINFLTSASLISEIGDISKFKTSAKLSRFAGISPVTYASGKKEVHFSNQRGNRQLNKIIRGLAVVLSRPPNKNNKAVNSYFHDYYKKKLSEGKTKMQSIKCLQRRLINIIFGMMKYKTEYRNPDVIYVESNSEKQSTV